MDTTYLIPPLTRFTFLHDVAPVEEEHPIVYSEQALVALLMERIGGLPQEVFVVVGLNTVHQLIGVEILYVGTLDTIQVRAAEVFRSAILMNAAKIIVAHNHPSGDLTFSGGDTYTTQLLKQAGEALSIPLLDHLLVSRTKWASMKEERGW